VTPDSSPTVPREPAILVVTSLTRPWTTVISLAGMHDISTAAELERCAAEHLDGCDRLLVDLTETSFVDSSIVNALVRLAHEARPRGITYQVVAVDGSHPHRVLALMGLLGQLGCVDALPEMQTRHAPRRTHAPESS
jgi:anti-anti-sigma factor